MFFLFFCFLKGMRGLGGGRVVIGLLGYPGLSPPLRVALAMGCVGGGTLEQYREPSGGPLKLCPPLLPLLPTTHQLSPQRDQQGTCKPQHR